MMIGPAPMTRIDSMSVLLGSFVKLLLSESIFVSRSAFLHHSHKPVEEVSHIVRPRARFRVPLEAKRGLVGEREPLQRAVEERYVGNARGRRQRRRIDGEAVVLAGDQHLSGILVEHRMVGAMMAEFHLQRLPAHCQAEELVAQANPERRYARVEKLADRADRVIAG